MEEQLKNNSPYRSLQEMLDNFNLKNEDTLNIYPYGSRVYGTASANSDYGTKLFDIANSYMRFRYHNER